MQTPVRVPVPLREIQPGKFFESVTRPPLAASPLPYRVEFGHVHMVDARETHLAGTHQHLHYEFIIVERGTYRCLINEAEVALDPGGVAIIKPGDWHRDQCARPVAFYALVLRVLPGPEPTLSANLLRDDLPAAQQTLHDAGGELLTLAERMRGEGRRGDPFTIPLLDSLAQEFAWRLMRQLPRERLDRRLVGGMDVHGFGSELLALFERHLDGNLSPVEMARALGIPERTLTSRCRAAFQAAPAKLFTRFRMERARVLLVQTDLSVKDVAGCLGFGNPYHFSTVYKRVHGTAPTHHRPA